MSYWFKIALALAAVWAVAGGAIYWARHAQPTSASVTAYLQHADLSAQRRAATIERMESMMNQVSYEDRQKIQRSGETREFFRKLTPAEQNAFLDATLPAGFKQMMESFNRMDPARRKKMVDDALANMKQHEGEEGAAKALDNPMAQKVVQQGLRSFYSDANADVKLDMAPLIEQMQRNLQGGGR